MEKELKQDPINLVKVVLFGPESTGKTTLSKTTSSSLQYGLGTQNLLVNICRKNGTTNEKPVKHG